MGHDASLVVETVDANTLDGTPNYATVALTDRGDGRADIDVLSLEAPVLEGDGALGNKNKSLTLQAKPHVAAAVAEDAPHFGGVEVDAEDINVVPLQLTTTA